MIGTSYYVLTRRECKGYAYGTEVCERRATVPDKKHGGEEKAHAKPLIMSPQRAT